MATTDWTLPDDYGSTTNVLDRYKKGAGTIASTQGQTSPTAYQDGSSDSDFLENVYQNETGRASDAWGKEYWQGQLDSGVSRNDVISAFGNTAEGIGYDSYVAPKTGLITGAQASGYTPETYTPGGRAETYGYNAPDKAGVERYDASKFNPDTDALAAYQLNKLTSRDDPYMQAARHSGEEYANSRGLLNSSLGAEASQAAAIKAASPFALQDAATVAQAGRDYANAQNRASEFGAGAENTASLAHNLQKAEADKFTASAENLASREEMAAVNRAAEYNATAINRAGEFYANAQNTASITNANNELSLALQDMRTELSNYSTDVARETALDQIAYNTMNMAMVNGVFNDPATSAGFFNTVAGIIPSLGIQIATNLADAIPLDEIA